MRFEIKINQKGSYGPERIQGIADSYEDAIALTNLIMKIFEETEVKITSIASNKTDKGEE